MVLDTSKLHCGVICVGIKSESERALKAKGEECKQTVCCCIKVSNDRVQSSGPTGLRPTLCSVISPDRAVRTLETLRTGSGTHRTAK